MVLRNPAPFTLDSHPKCVANFRNALSSMTLLNGEKFFWQGTGDVKEHLDHLKETNTKIYVSGMSAKARGYDENILKEYNAEFAMPDILIELSLEADSFLSF